MSKVLHKIAIGFNLLGLVFCITSISTSDWFVIRGGGIKTAKGLWKVCTSYRGNYLCNDYFPIEGQLKYKASRVFTILAIFSYGLSGLCLVLAFMKPVFIMVYIIGISSAALYQMIGMALFTSQFIDKIDTRSASFGWSYDMGWVGFSLTLISFCIGIELYRSLRNLRRERMQYEMSFSQ